MSAPEFEWGRPWSAPGETRQAHFRTPLAWVAGLGDGVLFVQDGIELADRHWVLMFEWVAWVDDVKAGPVDLHDPDGSVPWLSDPEFPVEG